MRIILASASPRRKGLLEKLLKQFEVIPAKGEEYSTKQQPKEVVLELSCQKAMEIEENINAMNFEKTLNNDGYLIIGADTVVAWEGKILGKPKDKQDAGNMLRMLSGNTHQVYTGVTLICAKNGRRECRQFVQETNVKFYPMEAEEIETYVQSGEPADKAGSYGIQGIGGRYIERIEGDYPNVVGLPVAKLYQVLKELNFQLPFL